MLGNPEGFLYPTETAQYGWFWIYARRCSQFMLSNRRYGLGQILSLRQINQEGMHDHPTAGRRQ
jgi:hypothetical protein